MSVLWSEEEDHILIEKYGSLPNKELMLLFNGRTVKSLIKRATKLGLVRKHKTPEERQAVLRDTHKTCPKCEENKPKEEFYKNKSKPDGLDFICKSCSQVKKAEYYLTKRDDILKRGQIYYNTNREDTLQRQRNYYWNHRERIRERCKVYTKANSSIMRVYSARRRAMLLNAIPSWVKGDEFEEFLISEIYDLRRLRSETSGVVYHVDHVIPLRGTARHMNVVCGLHDIRNLQLLPDKENFSKNSYVWPDMWDYSTYTKATFNDLLNN